MKLPRLETEGWVMADTLKELNRWTNPLARSKLDVKDLWVGDLTNHRSPLYE